MSKSLVNLVFLISIFLFAIEFVCHAKKTSKLQPEKNTTTTATKYEILKTEKESDEESEYNSESDSALDNSDEDAFTSTHFSVKTKDLKKIEKSVQELNDFVDIDFEIEDFEKKEKKNKNNKNDFSSFDDNFDFGASEDKIELNDTILNEKIDYEKIKAFFYNLQKENAGEPTTQFPFKLNKVVKKIKNNSKISFHNSRNSYEDKPFLNNGRKKNDLYSINEDHFFMKSNFNKKKHEFENIYNYFYEDDNKTPLNCDCLVKVQPKIIGGSSSYKGKYPFAAAIFTLVGRGSFCGATIINEYYLLTAAHCVQRHLNSPQNYNVVAGRTDLNVSDFKQESITQASNIWLSGKKNDVALVRLKHPLSFTQQVKPACFANVGVLPKENIGFNKFGFDNSKFNNHDNIKKYMNKFNRTLTAIGWGYVGWKVVKKNGNIRIRPIMTTKLQEVDLKETNCAKEEHLICVTAKNKSPCFGDSGSPLLYKHYDQVLVVGLTSRSSSNKGRYCVGAPTIYEKTDYYLPFIKTRTNRICVVN